MPPTGLERAFATHLLLRAYLSGNWRGAVTAVSGAVGSRGCRHTAGELPTALNTVLPLPVNPRPCQWGTREEQMRVTDGQLVARDRDGDREAFGHLVDRYRDMVYGLGYHLTGRPC